MRTVGIVAEYNPFHKGHEYQIQEAITASGADACVVCMSGDFVQRGEPSCASKWDRAKWALSCGADLVIELPVVYAASDAGRFARGGVSTLKAAGCDAISFGSECGSAEVLKKVAVNLSSCEREISELIKNNPGLSYPAARERAYSVLFDNSDSLEEELSVISSPNDTLAVEYIRRACEVGGMEIFPIMRRGAGYNDAADGEHVFQSATGIRDLIRAREDISPYVPWCVAEELKASTAIDCDAAGRFFMLAQYAIMTHTAEEIDDMLSGGDGLGARLKEAVKTASDLDELIASAKSRHCTYSRVSRLVCQLVLGIRREDYRDEIGYIRVLGFTDKGRQILSELKKRESKIPVITNLAKSLNSLEDEIKDAITLDVSASNVYSLISGLKKPANLDYLNKPIIK